MNDEVYTIKLISGEEVIAMIDESPSAITLQKPMLIAIQGQGVQLIPLLMFSNDDSVQVDRSNIVYKTLAQDKLAGFYKEQITGIVTAPANAIDGDGKLVMP